MSTSRAQRFKHILDCRLPFALPLYRRIQSPITSPYAHLLSSFDIDASVDNLPQCFALAYVDRSGRPERQGWTYLSAEQPGQCQPSDEGNMCSDCEAAVKSIVAQIVQLPVPAKDESYQSRSPANVTGGDPSFMAHFNNPDIFLLGTVHSKVARILDSLGVIVKDMPGLEYEYNKYIFDVTTMSTDDDLPTGLEWGEPTDRDLELVVQRSKIPRQVSSLRILPSVAIFPTTITSPTSSTSPPGPAARSTNDGAKSTEIKPERHQRQEIEEDQGQRAIAWAFLRPDSSLSSLHVEPAYRRRGLAKKVATKLMRDKGLQMAIRATKTFEIEGDKGVKWGHADVAVDNTESNGVCQALGGVVGWSVYWLRIDLRTVEFFSSSV